MRYVPLLAFSALSSVASAQSFSDGTFFDSQWLSTKLIDTTPAADATWSGIRGSGGNPDDCRTIAHNWQITPAGVSIAIAHLSKVTLWSPAAGPGIVGIQWSFDARCDSAPYVSAIGFGPLLRQNGRWFGVPGNAAIVGAGWTALGGIASAAAWVEVGGTDHPDFSPGAPSLEVGFFTSNGGSGTSLRNLATGRVDNYSIRIRRTCAGDLNVDGQVDDADFVLFVAAYNILDCSDPAMPAGCPSDFNQDGFVDDTDFVTFVAAYDNLLCP
ncbi:MAG: hypothetical protein U0573_02565 [Phycisphaerales bacterium]|nr:hypothetical protein [Planctomycetota bacterium]